MSRKEMVKKETKREYNSRQKQISADGPKLAGGSQSTMTNYPMVSHRS